MKNKPKLYGTEWCPKTSGFRNFFQREWIDFEYFDLESDENAKEEVLKMNGGKLKFPMVVIGDSQMKNPSIEELRQVIMDNS